jgi:Flp pilus assembly protein TadD
MQPAPKPQITSWALALLIVANCGCSILSNTASSEHTASVGDPKVSAEFTLALAQQHEQAGRLRDAVVLYERARQQDESLPRISRRLAVLYDQTGEPDKALSEFRAALQLSPRDSDLLNDFGYFQLGRGKFADAEQLLRKSLAANPRNDRARMNLAVTLTRQGRFEEARAMFSQVVGPAAADRNVIAVLSSAGERIPQDSNTLQVVSRERGTAIRSGNSDSRPHTAQIDAL